MSSLELQLRKSGYKIIVGIDEAGRGPLAGPVVAAAVCIRKLSFENPIRDSKKLSLRQREKAFVEIYDNAAVGVGIMNEAVVDAVNILEATYLAMNSAVQQLLSREEGFSVKEVCLLVDGNRFKSDLPYKAIPVVQGDQSIFSISCASVIAKVTRDRILHTYDRIYPEYGFAKHKGYPTRAHKDVIRALGPSEIHRRSFVIR